MLPPLFIPCCPARRAWNRRAAQQIKNRLLDASLSEAKGEGQPRDSNPNNPISGSVLAVSGSVFSVTWALRWEAAG